MVKHKKNKIINVVYVIYPSSWTKNKNVQHKYGVIFTGVLQTGIFFKRAAIGIPMYPMHMQWSQYIGARGVVLA